MRRWVFGVIAALLVMVAGPALAEDGHGGHGSIALAWSIPFVGLLAAIALMPFINKHFWEHYYPVVSFGLAALVAAYYFFFRKGTPAAAGYAPWITEMKEYVSFIVLLGSLFVVSGGIAIRVNREATPIANSVLLAIGAMVANIFGTTGAAMLLIRPYLRMNKGHIKPFHVVFFIFVVANAGGCLTPIGDPPLFLGYLKGIPFFWTVEHMWPLWALANGLIIAVFFVIDTIDSRKVRRTHEGDGSAAVSILGVHNFLFIGLILFAVFRESVFDGASAMADGKGSIVGVVFSREVLMLAAAVLARALTPRVVYQANEFSYAPIKEVAILFVGIFSTMVPALQWLETNADTLPLKTKGQFYYASGSLSSVLDNAPTYLTFLKTRMGELAPEEVRQAMAEIRRLAEGSNLKPREDLLPNVRDAIDAIQKYHPELIAKETRLNDEQVEEHAKIALLLGVHELNWFIVAISAGAVFFGACTYIGNGPNFMVKSIADSAGVQTPSFVGYIVKYTLPVLLPIYTVLWWIFLR